MSTQQLTELLPAAEACASAMDTYDAILAVGYHAKAGTEKAFRDHTQSLQWFECDDVMKWSPNFVRNGRTIAKTVDQIRCFNDLRI